MRVRNAYGDYIRRCRNPFLLLMGTIEEVLSGMGKYVERRQD
ncbi:hypothetical protein [Paenibacillus odorifer]|nr:hypothetical protein [Paenibacillus odorifer]